MALRKRYVKKARRVPRKRTIVRKAVRSAWKKSVAKVCKRVIGTQAEVKQLNETFSFSPRNALALVSDLATDNILWCSPNGSTMPISIGGTSQQRIGNKVRTKRCSVKLIMYPKPYSASTNTRPVPQIVTIWCCSAKQGYVSSSSMATIFDANFFQDGSTSSGYLGQLVDNISTVNKDVVQLHWKRTFKLGHSTMYGVPPIGTDVTYNNNAQFANNDYKQNIITSFDLTKHMPKNFNFDDANNTPNNRSVFLVFGIANADGQLFTSDSGQRPLDVYAQVNYFYTDM